MFLSLLMLSFLFLYLSLFLSFFLLIYYYHYSYYYHYYFAAVLLVVNVSNVYVIHTDSIVCFIVDVVVSLLILIFLLLVVFRMSLSGLITNGGLNTSYLPKICHTYPTMMKLGTVIPYLKKI